MIKKFLFNTNNIQRSAYLWNASSGIISAIQSVVFLIVVARLVGVVDAGIFSLAWAIAHLMLTVGRYSMRNYQVTDAEDKFTTGEYISSRIITSTAMMLGAVVYVVYGILALDYSAYKCMVIISACLLKLISSVIDVFTSWYQQKGRLDVAGKIETVNVTATMLTFIIVLFVSRKLLLTVLLTFAIGAFLTVLFCKESIPEFNAIGSIKPKRKVFELLWVCLPLCLTGFLTNYIGNAPKYAIDALMTDEMQAYYNYLFMPVFAIGLLASFIFNPIMYSLGILWREGNLKTIKRIILRQTAVISVITIAAIIAAYTIGIPILSWIYAADLTGYRRDLCILMMGGGFLALSSLFNVVIITVREQKLLLIGYAGAAAIARVLAYYMIPAHGLSGAAWVYSVTMLLLSVILGVIAYYSFVKGRCYDTDFTCSK